MTDEEFLYFVERRVFLKMFEGCLMHDHLGDKKYDTASWTVNLRADMLSRLLDMAKGTSND